MGINRGKQFEQQIRNSFENCKYSDIISIDRLSDPMGGYKGISNICDFTVFDTPHLFYLECKCCYGKSFPISYITKNQWEGLLEKSKIPSVIAGYIIWLIDYDFTFFVFASNLSAYIERTGRKSISADDAISGKLIRYPINGKKRKVLFDYDMGEFLDIFKLHRLDWGNITNGI